MGARDKVPMFLWHAVGFQRRPSRTEESSLMEAYCVKCKASKEMKEPQKVKMKNGRPAMKGKCPDCGTGLYRILKPT